VGLSSAKADQSEETYNPCLKAGEIAFLDDRPLGVSGFKFG